jgi:hypothetical protein
MFRVPESFTPALERIAGMPEENFQNLQAALASAKPTLKIQALIGQVQAALKIEIEDLSNIVQTVSNLSNARSSSDTPVEQLARDVSRPFSRKNKSFDPTVLERRLTSLLSIESLVFSARAFALQHEYGNLFISARIVSDVRPVLNPAGAEPVAAMIVHNLSLKYYHAGEYKEMFIALDEADVTKLRKVLDRADAKVASLARFIEKTGVQYLDSK